MKNQHVYLLVQTNKRWNTLEHMRLSPMIPLRGLEEARPQRPRGMCLDLKATRLSIGKWCYVTQVGCLIWEHFFFFQRSIKSKAIDCARSISALQACSVRLPQGGFSHSLSLKFNFFFVTIAIGHFLIILPMKLYEGSFKFESVLRPRQITLF